MIPAKNRERKCSTCKHYQASPLWRKGWCRNPLLYDRNTNHLVEADSLACNRTFIDYWEPLDERAAQSSQSASTGATGVKPRVAPSIPMETVDAAGSVVSSPDSTPAMGSAMSARSRKPMFKPLSGREPQRAPLSLVDEAYDELEPAPDPKTTQKMPQIERQRPGARPMSARERIQQTRMGRGFGVPQLSGIRLWIAVGALALVIVAVAALLLFNRNPTPTNPGNNPIVDGGQKTTVLPTVTGIGDNPPTASVPRPTLPVVAPVPTAIAIGGYAKVVKTGDGLIIRRTPAKLGERMIKVPDGTKLHVIDGPETADGFTWWKVDGFNPQSPDTAGWCVQNYLEPTAAP